MKLGLQNTINHVLEMIQDGDDFVVNEYKSGMLIKIPYKDLDTEPHVSDFKKAEVDDLIIATYFAYLIALPEYEVVSVKSNKILNTNEKPKFADFVTFNKIENKLIDKVEAIRQDRIKREKEEKEEKSL